MASNREIAEEIVKLIRESDDINKKTKNKIINEICRRLNVGSSTATDVLSQLKGLQVVNYQTVQRAKVYSVNEKNLGELEKITD